MYKETTKKRPDYANFEPDPKAKSGSMQKRDLGEYYGDVII